MLSSQGFDLWADDYDKTVDLSDEEDSYPFAGYKKILNAIYNRILQASCKEVLDVGFGTIRSGYSTHGVHTCTGL